ncbi:MAG: S8 family serine peptidase, partial [Gammaproteobacteria bacterium]|nr:S8 family serine peptidase [Gammaproteobacteria bacterium]
MNTTIKSTFYAITVSIFLMLISTMVLAVMPDNQTVRSSDPAEKTDNTKETVKYKADELLVKFKTTTAINKSNAVAHLSGVGVSSTTIDILSAKQFKPIKNNNNKAGVQGNSQASLDNWWHIKLAEGTDLKRALNILSARPDIEFVEYNYEIRALLTPNDPHFDSLWGLHNTQQTGGSFDADIDAPEAWDSHTGDANIIIAVIDTGVDYGHEDLAGNMWTNPGEIAGNLIDDDGNGYVDDVYGYDFINTDADPFDDHGHGTHVSGTIAGIG